MDSQEYQKVLDNKARIITALQLTPGATDTLKTQFQQKKWLPLAKKKPTEDELVDTVLGRIQLDTNALTTFIGMLKKVTGLDQIVELLEGNSDGAGTHSVVGGNTQPSHGMVGLRTIISKKQLDKIAGELLNDWDELSPSLELTQAQEKNIRRTYREYADQKREALRAWKHNKGKRATFGALIAAAEYVSNIQLADDIRDLMETLQDETQGRERSHQSRLGEQYDDEPDREDGNREKRQKTKPHQEGQLKSDSGPRSLAGEGDLRRRKEDRPSPKLETPPEDDDESDTNTPPPAEGNGEQNTKGSDSGTKNNNEPTVDINAGVFGTGITIKNVLKGKTAEVLVILILLVTLAVAVFFIVRELKK